MKTGCDCSINNFFFSTQPVKNADFIIPVEIDGTIHQVIIIIISIIVVIFLSIQSIFLAHHLVKQIYYPLFV